MQTLHHVVSGRGVTEADHELMDILQEKGIPVPRDGTRYDAAAANYGMHKLAKEYPDEFRCDCGDRRDNAGEE